MREDAVLIRLREAMQLALDLGADINAVDDHDETALHGAAYRNLPGAVKFLDSEGARIEIWNTKNELDGRPDDRPQIEIRQLQTLVGHSGSNRGSYDFGRHYAADSKEENAIGT